MVWKIASRKPEELNEGALVLSAAAGETKQPFKFCGQEMT